MELRHFQYFVAVAEALHFSRAAETLGIAPPTLSVQIQEIERALSAKLFLRTKRSVQLTPAGELFLVEARKALEQAKIAENVGRRAGRGELGRIEIGYVGSAAYAGVMQRQVSLFRRTSPDVEVNAREFPMHELPRLLEEGPIDVGFVRLPMTLPRGVRAHILARDVFCVALPTDHPLAATDQPLQPSDLALAPFVVPEQDAGLREVGLRGAFRPRIASTPGSLFAVLSQVSLGVGVAVVPNLLASVIDIPNLRFAALAGPPIQSEVAAIFRTNERAPATQALIRQILQSAEAGMV